MRRASVSPPRSDPGRLPSYDSLFRMLFFQPTTLKRRLEAAGVVSPERPVWALWKERGPEAPIYRAYVLKMLLLLVVVGVLASLAFAVLLGWAGYPMKTTALYLVVGAGVGLVASRAVGGRRGNVGADAVAATAGLSIGGVVAVLAVKRGGTPTDLESLATWRILLGAVLSLLVGSAVRIALRVANFVAFGVSVVVRQRIVASVARHMADILPVVAPAAGAVVAGVVVAWIVVPRDVLVPAFWTASLLLMVALPRLVLYPCEVLVSFTLSYLERAYGLPTLEHVPVLWHELAYLPYPWLREHLLVAAERDPRLVRRVLDACEIAPAQREIAREAQAQLMARELVGLMRRGAFVEIADLRGPFWLPGSIEGAPKLLAANAEIGRLVAQAEGSPPHVKVDKLASAEQKREALDRELAAAEETPLSHGLRDVSEAWSSTLRSLLAAAREEAKATLPNPFQLLALDPSAEGPAMFRGREALVEEIRALLIDSEKATTLALLGPRRNGKTSVLKMLPYYLKDTICVFFDTQAHALSTPADFFVALARQTHLTAEARAIDVPELAEGASFDAGAAWFQSLPDVETRSRILICIDEVERLEVLYGTHPRDTERLLGLLRAAMQHQTRVRLILSAKAPFSTRPELWSDHFISVQEIWLDNLEERDAIALLNRPTPDFPTDALDADIARSIFERTGGQPFLLQACGFYLIGRINRARRRRATVEDVDEVERTVLVRCRSYFQNVLDEAQPDLRAAIEALAHDTPVALSPQLRRELRDGCLISGTGALRVPMLGRWIREHASDSVSG